MAYGFSTYDQNGNYNNYGIRPTSVAGFISVSENQTSGSFSVQLPEGTKLTYLQVNTSTGYTATRRKINISGGQATISSAASNDYSSGTETAYSGFIVFQVEVS